MKNKSTTDHDFEVYLEIPDQKRKEIRNEICEEFAIKDIDRPEIGYQYNNRACQQCTLWGACMFLGYHSSQEVNHKKVKEHFNLKYFFSESKVLQSAEEYVSKLVKVVNVQIEQKGFVDEKKLQTLLDSVALDKLYSLDPEIPKALMFNIIKSGNFKVKNGKITR